MEDDTGVGTDKLSQELHVLQEKVVEKPEGGERSKTFRDWKYTYTDNLNPSMSLQMLPSVMSQF